jgi:cytochrome c
LLASADPKRGESVAKVCQTCHTFEKGGPNKVGPNLWGIVGRPKVEPGFNYSAAMKAKGGDWTIPELNDFLANPRGYIPGTAMSFAGLPRPQQRADVIDYLNTLSDNPKPLPTETASKPPEGAKPTAEAGKPEAGKPAPGQPADTAASPKQ